MQKQCWYAEGKNIVNESLHYLIRAQAQLYAHEGKQETDGKIHSELCRVQYAGLDQEFCWSLYYQLKR